MQALNKTTYRSDCPINFSLEILGDTWSLLILRDIVYFGKKTYNEFLASDEHIAPNILASRLKRMQNDGLLVKQPHPIDGRKEVYKLTEDGLDLIPVLFELANWGTSHVPKESLPQNWLDAVQNRRDEIIPIVRNVVSNGGSIFVGEDNVIKQLAL